MVWPFIGWPCPEVTLLLRWKWDRGGGESDIGGRHSAKFSFWKFFKNAIFIYLFWMRYFFLTTNDILSETKKYLGRGEHCLLFFFCPICVPYLPLDHIIFRIRQSTGLMVEVLIRCPPFEHRVNGMQISPRFHPQFHHWIKACISLQ